MDDREHVDLVRLDVVDDSVGAFQHFPNLAVLKLGHGAARERELGNLLGSSGQAVNSAQSVLR